MNEVKKVIGRMSYITKHNVIVCAFRQTLGIMKFSQHTHTHTPDTSLINTLPFADASQEVHPPALKDEDAIFIRVLGKHPQSDKASYRRQHEPSKTSLWKIQMSQNCRCVDRLLRSIAAVDGEDVF